MKSKDQHPLPEDESSDLHYRFAFNRAIEVVDSEPNITSDAGALLLRETIHRLGIDKMLDTLHDPRDASRTRYSLPELILFRVIMLALGYSAQDDADKLAHDPAFRIAAWDRSGDHSIDERLASQPTLSRLIDILSPDENFRKFIEIAAASLMKRLALDIGSGHGKRGTVDIDGFPKYVQGKQIGAVYNGHYHGKVFYPFVAGFSLNGDYATGATDGFLAAKLRTGDAGNTAESVEFIDECLDRIYASLPGLDVDFRFDAAFPIADVINHLDARNVKFVGRLKSNPELERRVAHLVTRKPGPRPDYTREYVYEIGEYGASTWHQSHRVVLVVVDEPPEPGELDFGPRWFFLVTSHPKESMSAEALLSHYRNRGTFEDRIGEFNDAIDLNLSHQEFRKNEVLLQFGVFAFNLLSVLRAEMEVELVGVDLGRMQKRLLRAGGRIVKHSRRLVLKIAKTAGGWWRLGLDRLEKMTVAALRRMKRTPWKSVPIHAHLSTPHPMLE